MLPGATAWLLSVLFLVVIPVKQLHSPFGYFLSDCVLSGGACSLSSLTSNLSWQPDWDSLPLLHRLLETERKKTTTWRMMWVPKQKNPRKKRKKQRRKGRRNHRGRGIEVEAKCPKGVLVSLGDRKLVVMYFWMLT